MRTLQLAENRALPQALPATSTFIDNPYIKIPASLSATGSDLYVREDYLDDLTADDYEEFIAYLDAVDEAEGGLGDRAARQARREARRGRRAERKTRRERRRETRTQRKEARTMIKQAKAGAAIEGDFQAPAVVDGINNFMTGAADVVGGIFGGGGDDAIYSEAGMAPRGVPTWVWIAGGGALLIGGIMYARKKKK